MLFGPLVGGLLSGTAGGILKAFPYAAPNIFIASIYAAAAIAVFFGLDETSQHVESGIIQRVWDRLVRGGKSGSQNYTSLDTNDPDAHPLMRSPDSSTSSSPVTPVASEPEIPVIPAKKNSTVLPFRKIWTKNVFCTMLAHFIIAGHLGTFGNLWAIFLSTPISTLPNHPPLGFTGGLGMVPREVGIAMSALGAIGVTLQLAIYPMLNDRFGTVRLWRGALLLFPVVYALAPFPALVASSISSPMSKWISMLLVSFLFVAGRTGATPATTLLINDCTPHPSARGTIHTLGTVIGNLSRSFFPIIAFSIFGKGVEVGIVGLGFWALAGVAVLACVASNWVAQGNNGAEEGV
jgi:hypothetical protein